jgi:hypothetical protein
MNPSLSRAARPIAVLGALAALAGIALAIVVESIAGSDADALASPMSIVAMAASLAGLVALVIAIAGLASGATAPRGRLGTVATVTALAGATLTAGASWSGLVIAPWFAMSVPASIEPPEALLVASTLSYALLGLGSILLAIAIRRDGTAPGWATALLIIGGILCIPPFLPARYTLVVVAVAALLLSRPHTPAAVRSPTLA